MLQLKLQEKQGQDKPKTSRRREIKILRAEINEIETKKKYKESMKQKAGSKSWFFQKINKIDKNLANLTKMRREKTQINSETKKER
jgi:hypothetical protein